MTPHEANRAALAPLRAAMYDWSEAGIRDALAALMVPDCAVHLAYPFEDLDGAEGLWASALDPLATAWPDIERRDYIVMAGTPENGSHWVGLGGYYTGTFLEPWLDIPPTGHQAAMRFHEFYRMEGGRCVEMQALWDIPEVMMQARAWPMAPSLGREWLVPAPAMQDGVMTGPRDGAGSDAALQLVSDMLSGLGNFATGGVEAMELGRYWHPNFSWYGPAGIGTGRGIAGFRNWHQIPFLNGMPDRVGSLGQGNLFADNAYVGFTAWPGMHMSVTGDGFLGIAPAGQKITMRSLDFWRCEAGLIRENWVLVDLLDVYAQLGVDVLGRMREFNKARYGMR